MRSAFMPRSTKPRRSKRATTSPTRPRATPLGLTMMNVRSMRILRRAERVKLRAAPAAGGAALSDRRQTRSKTGGMRVDVGLAERADPPLRVDRLAARRAAVAQAPAARGAHQVVLAHRRLAEGAALLLADARLHHRHLELVLLPVGEGLGRAHDGVDDEPDRPEHDAGEHARPRARSCRRCAAARP